jgi:hypothetical protein
MLVEAAALLRHVQWEMRTIADLLQYQPINRRSAA